MAADYAKENICTQSQAEQSPPDPHEIDGLHRASALEPDGDDITKVSTLV